MATADEIVTAQHPESSEGSGLLVVERPPLEVVEDAPEPVQHEATFWSQASEGTRYWRLDVPARHLPGQVLDLRPTDAEIVPGTRDPILLMFPRQAGAAIWQFPGEDKRGLLMRGMQIRGIPTLVEVDDNYLIPFPHSAGRGSWHRDIHQASAAAGAAARRFALAIAEATDEERPSVWETFKEQAPSTHSHDAHRRICEWVDGIIVSTEALAKQYRKVNERVFVCRNAVDPADWPKRRPRKSKKAFRIGYAASPSHQADLKLVRRALEWAAEQDGVEVVYYGLLPSWADNVLWSPWAPLPEYRKRLEILDVGVCPLVENAWSVGKSDIKAMEYAMVGALPVVSRSEPYRDWWEKELPCLHAGTAKEFFHAIKWCVENRDEVKEIAREARLYCLRERNIETTVADWQTALDETTRYARSAVA